MISHRMQCIFVHIPKTGGTTIEKVFWRPEEFVEENLWMGFVTSLTCKYQTGGLQHLKATHILNEVGQDVFDRYYKFSVVRNPWDKMVSAYHYCRRLPVMMNYLGLREEDDFAIFVRLTQKRNHVHWEEQHRFLYDDHDRLLIDEIVRFEDLSQAIPKLPLGQTIAPEAIPHLNKSQRGPYQTYYDEETRNLVANRYRRDIELFDYQFAH